MKTFLNKKATNKSPVGLAVLTKKVATNLAVLTFGGCAITSNESNRVQILPDGYFVPTDGRDVDVEGGQWLMDAQAFASLTANITLRKNDFMFDYEHQTLYTEQNGKPAPAAGWFKKLDYVPGEGLFAIDVDWTPTATKHISDKEYRYTSAVFSYDLKTGRPIELMHVALTNEPALDGMKAITALKTKNHLTGKPAATTGEIPMNEALKLMLDLLGIAHTDDDLSNTVALTAIQDKAKVAIAALKSKADKTGQLEKDLNIAQTSVTALKAKQSADDKNVDLSKFVPKATYDGLVEQVAQLSSQNNITSIDNLLKNNSDKYVECEIDYLKGYGEQKGVAALKSLLDNKPVMIAALKTTQTQGKKKPDGNNTGTAALTAEQKYTADQLGMSHADLLTSINKEAK